MYICLYAYVGDSLTRDRRISISEHMYVCRGWAFDQALQNVYARMHVYLCAYMYARMYVHVRAQV